VRAWKNFAQRLKDIRQYFHGNTGKVSFLILVEKIKKQNRRAK